MKDKMPHDCFICQRAIVERPQCRASRQLPQPLLPNVLNAKCCNLLSFQNVRRVVLTRLHVYSDFQFRVRRALLGASRWQRCVIRVDALAALRRACWAPVADIYCVFVCVACIVIEIYNFKCPAALVKTQIPSFQCT